MFYNPIEGKSLGTEVYSAIAGKNPNLKNIKEATSYNDARMILSNGLEKCGTTHIFIGSNKGGVGKSMIALQLAWFLNARGYKVLLADLDAQANITSPLLKDDLLTEAGKSLYNVIVGDSNFDDIISEVTEGFDLMGANQDLSKIDYLLRSRESGKEEDNFFARDKRSSESNQIYQNMYEVFKKLGEDYDFVIYDTNPETNTFNRLSMQVSDIGIIPIQAKESSAKAHMVTLSEINDSFISINRDNSNIQDRVKLLFNNKESIPESKKKDILNKMFRHYSGSILNDFIEYSYELGEVSDVGYPAFAHPDIDISVLNNISNVVDEIVELARSVSSENNDKKKRHLFFNQL